MNANRKLGWMEAKVEAEMKQGWSLKLSLKW